MVLNERKLLEQVSDLNAEFKVEWNKVCVCSLKVQAVLVSKTNAIQEADEYLQFQKGETYNFHVRDDVLRVMGVNSVFQII